MDAPYTPFKLFNNKQWQLCYTRYLAHVYQRCNSEQTVTTYQYVLRALFSDPKRTPDAYTNYEIEAFVSHTDRRKGFEGKPPSARTYNHRLGVLQSFYGYASTYEMPFRNGHRPILRAVNPTTHIRPLVTSQVNRTLSEDEVARIFAVVPKTTIKGLRDRALIRFYLLSGRRRAEIIRLKWEDIYRERGQWVYQYKAKGRRDLDKDVLPTSVKADIDAYLVASGRKDTIQLGDQIFVSVYDGKPLTGKGFARSLKRYAQEAGVRFSCHWFRHTNAIMLYVETGHDIVKVSKHLGHRSIAHTQTYLDGAMTMGTPEIAALERKFGDL